MICFVRLVGGTKFDSLKRDFSQIHSSTNEGIVTCCGSKVQVCILWWEEIERWEENQWVCKT